MIVGTGVDIAEVHRIRESIERFGERFLRRIFTEGEITYCQPKANRFESYAARFAAKEAVMKALGTGARSVGWREIEVLPDRRGKPLVYLYGGAADRAAYIGLEAIDISLSHLESFAMVSESVKPGVCYTTQPERLSIGRRNRGSHREFGDHPEDLLAGF